MKVNWRYAHVQECAAARYIPEGTRPDEIIDTGLRTFILDRHQSAVSARMNIYYLNGRTYVVSTEHYGESPDDWCIDEIVPPNAIRDWYVASVLEDFQFVE